MSENYPTENELEIIRKWDAMDFIGLMEFIHSIWAFEAWGWKQDNEKYYVSTGGWSGNESIIEAMQDNYVWWAMYWEQSNRGGHYIFQPISVTVNEILARSPTPPAPERTE